MNLVREPETAVGLSAFDSLRAEEEPWLDQCHVPPPDFDLIAGTRSYLVIGEEGSGKTALFQALRARLEPPPDVKEAPSRLVVHWRPRPLEPGLVGSAAAERQLAHVLGDCADALLAYLGHWPLEFQNAAGDLQRTLVWFICHYLGEETEQRIAAHAAQAPPVGRRLLCSLLSRYEPDEWLSTAGPSDVISELIKSLRAIGPRAVYVLVNPDDLGVPRQMVRDLKAFLSSLTLFENRHFVYKMIFPESLGESLAQAGVVDRRRVELSLLRWSPEDLTEIVVRRIELAARKPIDGLADVCEDPTLIRWLERTGGHCPRGWLKGVSPLVARYLQWGRPIVVEEWKKIRKNPSPPLTFDDEKGVITVGWRRIEGLPEIPLALFRYLWEHRGRLCTRQELYHRAYLPVTYPDTPLEESQEYPAEYDHILDSAMSRLRKLIEPDPRSQLYLITERGKGYRLENA